MEDVEIHGHWLKRGRQKRSVVLVMRKPMTPAEIRAASHDLDRHIQLRDIWFILRQLEKRGLVYCLNPHRVTGDLYFLTQWGRQVAATTLGIAPKPEPDNVNWHLYAHVASARTRRIVLLELARLERRQMPEITAAVIHKDLRANYPIGLNQTVRALRELTRYRLVLCTGLTKKGMRRKYRLSEAGRIVVDELLK